MKYPVLEIFDSIQGEGSMIGMPVTFIRFKGCNLACPWCDTKESWKKPEADEGMTIEEIVEQCHMTCVVLTGGEPCLNDLVPLITAMQVKNKYVCIETNGTLPTPENADWIVASPKPPEYKIHAECFFNELKYVCDEDFSVDCIPPAQKNEFGCIWIQPCDYGKGKEEQTKASYERAASLPLQHQYLRTGIQLHKILNVK